MRCAIVTALAFALGAVSALAGADPVGAPYIEQTFSLVPGWNAIWLEDLTPDLHVDIAIPSTITRTTVETIDLDLDVVRVEVFLPLRRDLLEEGERVDELVVVRVADARQLEKMFDVLDHGARIDIRPEIHNQVSERIDEVIALDFGILGGYSSATATGRSTRNVHVHFCGANGVDTGALMPGFGCLVFRIVKLHRHLDRAHLAHLDYRRRAPFAR